MFSVEGSKRSVNGKWRTKLQSWRSLWGFFTIELILVLPRTCPLPCLCFPLSAAVGTVGRYFGNIQREISQAEPKLH